jgi:hypothetical protein
VFPKDTSQAHRLSPPTSTCDSRARRDRWPGNLAGDGFDRYTVSLTKGAVLQARLERFKGLDAVLRVTDVKGQPVDARADGRRTWASPVPASGAYRVDVVRKAPFCDPPLTYLLTLSAR